MAQASYDHVQRGRFHLAFWGLGALLLPVGAFMLSRPAASGGAAAPLLLAVGGVMVLAGFCFQHLRVTDRGDHLAVAFGPLRLFRRRVRYAEIVGVDPSRSTWGEGWGVHASPGGGWTWNIWGREIVELRLRKGRLRLGTDDSQRLLAHLRARLRERGEGRSA